LDEIDRCTPRGHAVPIVTFNYDRLVEEALANRGHRVSTLNDYVSNERFKLFKLHGSIDWVRGTGQIRDKINQWDAMSTVVQLAASLTFAREISIATDYPTGIWNDELVAPALAIPLETKTTFECPDEHLALLRDLLREASSILIVGWRATEK